MTQPQATTRPRTILYLAGHEATASDGAERLESADIDGHERSVRSATTLEIERVEKWAPAVDCVVFAETPTTTAGSNLLDVVEACDSTPLVLFTDSSFTPAAARSTGGIDGYVRSDTDDAIAHLADEIEWICRDRLRTHTGAETPNGTERDRFRTLFAAIPDPAVGYELEDGEPIVRAATDAIAAVFGIEPADIVGEPVDEWLVPSDLEHRRTTLCEALRAGERRQFERRHDTDDGIRDFLVTLEPLESATSDAGATVDDNPSGLLVYHDVTELHRCRRARGAADARLEAITDLLEDDIWPSLNVARGHLGLATDTGESEHVATVADAQERVEAELERLATIAERDGTLVDTEPVGVHDIARQAWISVETGETRLVTRDATDRILEANKARLRELFEHLFRLVVDTETVPAVVVGVTDDGFSLTQYDPEADIEAVDALEMEMEPVASRDAALDGTDVEIDVVESIADAHGWTIDVVENDGQIAVVCRGVVGERALHGI